MQFSIHFLLLQSLSKLRKTPTNKKDKERLRKKQSEQIQNELSTPNLF
ncbi:MAG: hypothetical protein WA631_02385 [Nitrososphaeraceae archaeon]